MSDKCFIYFIFLIIIGLCQDIGNVMIPRFIFNPLVNINNFSRSSSLKQINHLNIPNDTLCKESISKLIKENINNPLFRPFIEYGGKGLNSFGNYPSCQNFSNMSYFFISIFIPPTPYPVGSVGSCFPNVCTNDTLALALKDYMKNLIQFITPSEKINLLIIESKSYNIIVNQTYYGFYICISCLILYLLIVITSTLRKYYIDWFKKNKPPKKDSMTIIIFNCFNLKDNIEGIVKTENRVDPKLNTLQFLRCVGMFWVVIGHSFLFSVIGSTSNFTEAMKQIVNDKGMAILRNGTVSVDMFFILGGFLSTMAFISAFEKEQMRTTKNLLLLYFHRYARLFPMMFLCWAFTSYLLPVISHGINTSSALVMQHQCKTRFLETFFYIDNYLTDMNNFCNGWIWYLYIDLQLFILTPLIVFPAMKSNKLGIFILLILSCASYGYQIYLFQSDQTPASMLKMHPNYNKVYYQQPYTRCNVYFVGVFFCYLYYQFKGKKLFQSPILKWINNQFKNRIIRYIVSISGLGMMIFVIFAQNWFDHAQTPIPQYQNTLFLLFNRVVFGLGMMLVVYPAMLSFSRPLCSFFSYPLFNIMGKITYGTYMIHLLIMTYMGAIIMNSFVYSFYPLMIHSIAIFFLTYLVSFISTAVFESPIVQLLKLLSQSQSKSSATITNQKKLLEIIIENKDKEEK